VEKAKSWKTAEHIAALLEKTVTPEAQVQHNVLLPVIGRPDRKPRQCDVVVKYGKVPRTSLAIVEVQKRNKKPDINTFHGWVAKMREVGAQQLICVSEHGYPQSIIDEVAQRIGPTVKLMTLRQLERGDNIAQLVMLPFSLHTTCTYDLLSLGKLQLHRDSFSKGKGVSQVQVSTADTVFSIGREGPLINLNELVAGALTGSNLEPSPPAPKASIEVELKFNSQHDVWFLSGTRRLQVRDWPVRVRAHFTTTQRNDIKIDVSHLVYRQEAIDGVLAWVAKVKIEQDGVLREFQVSFKRNPDGYLSFAGFASGQQLPSRSADGKMCRDAIGIIVQTGKFE